MNTYTRTIPSSREATRNLLSEAMAFFHEKRSEGLARQVDEYHFRLALDETVENALRHGNSFDPNKSIGFSLKILKTRAVITVSDDGEGFNPGELPNPRLCENFFKHSGRGVFLLKNLCKVSFNAEGNRVTSTSQ